eukprot:gene20255-26297_t
MSNALITLFDPIDYLTGEKFFEECFEQSQDNLVFKASGLAPGTTYSLRVIFYERGNAIAVSVRNFHVAGIRGVSEDVVTIKTAMQLALSYQLKGMEEKAEQIYLSILSEFPHHPEALHLLGVVFYQRGDPVTAIPYIQLALNNSNNTYQGFHNSLGECYRALGRYADAVQQFQLE